MRLWSLGNYRRYGYRRSGSLPRHYFLLFSFSLLLLCFLFFKDGQPEIVRGGFPYSFLKEYNPGAGRVRGAEGRHLLQEQQLGNVTLLLYIISAPGNRAERAAIRNAYLAEDWRNSEGMSVRKEWKHWFVVGRPGPDHPQVRISDLLEEQAKYGDILIPDLSDSYHNLVLKTLFLLHHAKSHSNYQFLMKADDDTFLNIGLLLEYLQGKEGTLFFGGNLTPHGWRVDRQGLWRIPKEQWTPAITPKYHGGPGYVLSQPAVEELMDVWDSGRQPLIFVEDIFVGALAHRSGTVEATLIPGWQTVSMTVTNCYHPSKVFLQHKLTPEDITMFMGQHREGKHYCHRVNGVNGVKWDWLSWVPWIVVYSYGVFVLITHYREITEVLLIIILMITNFKEIASIVTKASN